MTGQQHAVCDYCARLRPLRADGLVAKHYITLPISRRAVSTVGTGQVRRLCSGSGKPPRRTTP